MANVANLYETMSAFGTVSAALAGLWAAWIARDSARAAQATVEEAREARRLEVMPRFTLERQFHDIDFQWPTDITSTGAIKFLARSNDLSSRIAPSFRLENFGQGPAVEVRVIFEIVDLHGDLTIPPEYAKIGLSNGTPSTEGFQLIQFSPHSPGGIGLPMYRRMRIDFPHLAPGQAREVIIPDQLMSRIIARGLQNRGIPQGKELKLFIKVEGYTSDGDLVSSQFRYAVNPFAYGPTLPQQVSAHFEDLHMHDRDSDTLKVLW